MVAIAGPQLPPDSSGKVTGAFSFGSAPVIWLPAGVLVDSAGNELASSTADPAGTERALLVREAGHPDVQFLQSAEATGAWTSATALNSTVALNVVGYSVATITLNNVAASFSSGTFTFEASDDGGTTWFGIIGSRIDAVLTDLAYGINGGDRIWQFNVAGLTNIRARLNPVLVGSGTANVRIQAQTGSHLAGVVVGGTVGVSGSGNAIAVRGASSPAVAGDAALVVAQSPMRADAAVSGGTVTAATGVAATLTLGAPGAGLFHYIVLIEIELYATAARTGGATPVLVTTTNLPGSPVWDFDTAQAIGTTIRKAVPFAPPVKSSAANTATTIVAPIATTGIWRINAYYYTAP